MGGPSESRIRMEQEIRDFAEHLLVRAPAERAENKTAARLVDLSDARSAAHVRAVSAGFPNWFLQVVTLCPVMRSGCPF